MSQSKWNVKFIVYRKKEGQPPRYDEFMMEVDPDEYVLDGVERIWAYKDRTLSFQHACHHSVCGACGMRVNGVEKLTCITPIRDVTHDGGTILVEPLRNFEVVSDLVPDLGKLYSRMEGAGAKQVYSLAEAPTVSDSIARSNEIKAQEEYRLGDCIECGLCISACPVAGTAGDYLGPAVLAAIQLQCINGETPAELDKADSAQGVWRCHSAYECSAVCPSNVEPGWRIMDLRRQIIAYRIRKFFGQAK